MFAELIRALVQRMFRDKIFMGLVIILVVSVFVGLVGVSGDDKKDAASAPSQAPPAGPAAHAQTPGAQPPQPAPLPSAIDPKLATEFVTWWIGSALDYSKEKSGSSRKEAIKWMDPQAVGGYENAFWQPQMVQGIESGQIVAAFQPVSIHPVAINPDGSVVVSVRGTFVQQVSGMQPETKVILADMLVCKESDGLRIGNLYVQRMAVMHQPQPQQASMIETHIPARRVTY